MKIFIKYWIIKKAMWSLCNFLVAVILVVSSIYNTSLFAKEIGFVKNTNDSIFTQQYTLSFSSNKLHYIYKLLPEDTKIKLETINLTASNTIFIEDDNISNRYGIIIKSNDYNELIHIGLSVFPEELTESYYSEVFEYIERELLTYLLLQTNDEIRERMNRNNVELQLNGNLLNTKDLIASYLVFDEHTQFKLNNDSKYFIAIWRLNKANLITMKFPNDYTVIAGKQKDEIENEILRDLKHIDCEIVINKPKRNIDGNINCNNIYISHGNIYNESPNISSDSYFYTCDSATPVFDTLNYKESLNNLLLNLVPTHTSFQIRHKLYGNIEDNYKININEFFDYFSKNHQFFVGWSSDDKENLNASVFIYNVPLGYVHLLVVEPSMANLTTINGTIDGTLYTFIRKNNLK